MFTFYYFMLQSPYALHHLHLLALSAGVAVRLYERSTLGGRLGSEELADRLVGLGATYVKARDPIFKASCGTVHGIHLE